MLSSRNNSIQILGFAFMSAGLIALGLVLYTGEAAARSTDHRYTAKSVTKDKARQHRFRDSTRSRSDHRNQSRHSRASDRPKDHRNSRGRYRSDRHYHKPTIKHHRSYRHSSYKKSYRYNGYWRDYHYGKRKYPYRYRHYNGFHYYYDHRGFYFPNYGHIRHGHYHDRHCPSWHFESFAAAIILSEILGH